MVAASVVVCLSYKADCKDLKKINSRRVREFKAMLKTRLLEYKRELKRVSKERNEENAV